MSGWVRVEPLVAPAADCGGDIQIGDGFNARWVQEIPGEGFAVVSRSFYVAYDDTKADGPYLECQTEYVLCTDLDDPGSTELYAEYLYTNCGEVPVADEATYGTFAVTAAVEAPEPDDDEWMAAMRQAGMVS